MSARIKSWARRARVRLLLILGNRCVHCGATNCLTFDCIRPTGDAHHRMSTDQRMCYYHKQSRAGNLQILCADCNTKKSARENPAYIPACTPASTHSPAPPDGNFFYKSDFEESMSPF
jgi:5-methylcytosine-specific restriction endonuclease McrA